MQAQHEITQQRRSSIAHSRQPTSSSSIGAAGSSQTFDSQQQQQQQQFQNEAQAAMQRRPSQTAASQLTKLDGVIYHFYTTTANLVIQSRLAHLRPLLLTTPPFDSTPSEQRPASAAGTSSQTKLSRWFGLHIPDSDLFKEELRFWRSVTTLMGLNSLDDEPSTGSSGVPDLVVDILLDLSRVSERHEILILTSPSTSGSARFTQSNASSSCLCIDGRKPGEAASLQPSSRPQRIVLERWRLRFDSKQPSDPPDLSTFYKRSVVHFRTLFAILCSLPANRLSAKIEALKAATEDRGKFSHPSHPSLAAREDMGSYDAEMSVGCRLGMASDAEHVAPSLPEEINVTDALPAERNLSLSENDEAEPMSDDRITSHGHYATRTLPPIATPVGHLELSVTYRKLTGFSIEDAESLRNANDLKVDLDEDYFRTAQRAEPTPSQPSNLPTIPTTSPPQVDSQPETRTGSTENSVSRAGTSQFPAPAQQRIGGISAARPATLAAQRYSPDATPAGTEALLSQSPSVFSTSASGRHSAGLSSLRRTSSNKSNVPLLGPANPSAAPSSPALAAALSAEPAFAVPSSVRRPSTSERRLRTLSGLSSGQPSPPVSPAAATFELPEADSSVPRSTSAAFSTSVTGRSISTRTTSGFSSTMTGNMAPPSSQPRPSVSFSPSSPSPLAQQMSLQGSRAGGGQGLAPSTSQSVSSFRSVSGSGLRSSMSGTGVLTTPSLRSVFQTYVPRSQTVSTTSMARTPPTSTSVFTHGSYSPSNLGTGLRSSSVRRNSSTSDAGSGSAFGPSIASSSAAAAKPQMIKRYSTNFSYRQNRERSGIYGSSLGSEGSGSVGAGAEPSSFPRFGGGGSLSSAYGRSWMSKMEQRQGLGTGGAFARTSSLDDATAAATASSASRYRPVTGTSATHMGGLTPSPRSHDEDMDDLVRLLETRPALGTSSMGKLTSLRNERRNAPGLSSTPEEGGAGRAGPASDALTDSVQCNLGQDRPSSLSGSGLRSGAALRTANPMSRSQLDELLNRMAESFGIPGSKEPSSSASGETSSDVAASDDTRNQAVPSAAPGAPARSSAPQSTPSTQPLTAAQIAATLGKGRGSQSKEAESAADTPAGRVSSPGTFGRAVSGDAGLRSRSAVGQQVRAYGTSAVRAASSSSLTTEQGTRFSRDSAAIPSTTAVGPSIANSDQMPEYEAEGDLIFKVDGQPDYDPEDELPGEMEMVAEEGGPTGTAVRSADAVTSTFGGGVEGGMGATLPVGAHREGRTHDWHAADRWERERALEAERRRADAEMSRNFGQEVGASTRGRGSHSPWRASTHSPAQQQQTAAVPMSLQPPSTAGAVGFRSSSTRPLAGTTNRLVGVSGGGGSFGEGGKRGYGVSAPSTQFHYPSGQGAVGNRPAANSYPVSRDEMFDDDEDGADE